MTEVIRERAPRRIPLPRLSRSQIRRFVTYVILTAVAIIWIYPLVWMLSSSFKPMAEFFTSLSLIPQTWDFQNYVNAWAGASIGHNFINSVIVTCSGVVIVLLLSSTMGYVLGRYRFPGKRLFIGLLGLLAFIPQGYTIVPIFDLISNMHLDGNLFGIILAQSGSAHIIIILLFAGYFAQIPKELEEAAIVDGAGFVRIFWQIMLPLAKPVIATGVILQFITSWNDFLIPLVLTLAQPGLRTLAVGIYFLQGVNEVQWTEMAAASVIALAPVVVVFLAMQRYFINGIAAAVKG